MAKNNNLTDFLSDIASSIKNVFGITGNTLNAQDFKDKIDNINVINKMEALPVTIKTLQMKTGTMNVGVSPYVRIMDESGTTWSIEDWHAAAVARGFNRTGPAPIGLDIQAGGEHFCLLFKMKYNDDAGSGKTWYDVTGTVATTDGGLYHSHYQSTYEQFSNSNKTVAYGDATTGVVSGTSTISGDTIILSTSNSPFTYSFNKCTAYVNSFDTKDPMNRTDMILAFNEWYRVLQALETNITTTEPDGTIGTVTILNSSGSRPTPATDDMYFYINGVNTGILAKYNVRSILTSLNLTQSMADTIYNTQKTNGVTMNDDYASLSSGATKVVLTEGCKGAEAYAYNGHWYITTPVLSRCDATKIGVAEYFLPDTPAISYVKWLRTYFNNNDIFMPNERMLSAVRVNRPNCVDTIINYLKDTSKGEGWPVKTLPSGYVWSPVRFSAIYAWVVYLSTGGVAYSSVYNRYVACGAFAL